MQADVFRAWITAAASVIEEQRDHLTQLDAAIGDADHGINLSRGFAAVTAALGGQGVWRHVRRRLAGPGRCAGGGAGGRSEAGCGARG